MHRKTQDFQDILKTELESEKNKQTIYQSDNGHELKNKYMRKELNNLGVLMRHSKPYNPRTNGKAENRVKVVAQKFAAEIFAWGGLSKATVADIIAALASATSILNWTPGSTSTYRPFEASCQVDPIRICRNS